MTDVDTPPAAKHPAPDTHSAPLRSNPISDSHPRSDTKDEPKKEVQNGPPSNEGKPQGMLVSKDDTVVPTPHPPALKSTNGAKPATTSDLPTETQSPETGYLTPPARRRRSVQFARGASDNEVHAITPSRDSSPGPIDRDALVKDRRGHHSLLSKLKAITASSQSGHSRSASAGTAGPDSAEGRDHDEHASPASERGEFRFPWTHDDGSDADADAESSSGEQAKEGLRKKMKRKMKRPPPQTSGSAPQTAPSTPKSSQKRELRNASSGPNLGDEFGFSRFRRRSVPSAGVAPPLRHREGLSEDEGRERLNRDSRLGRRNGLLQSARGWGYAPGQSEGRASHDERRPHLRRITGFGGPLDHSNDRIAAAWRRHKAGGGTSLSAQRWRQIKAGLKMIGQRRKAETAVDHIKSAELLAELTSGIPAALLLASMFQRDEHGSKRIPILLEQLKVHITDSRFDSHSGDRHLVFRIELEYGSGVTRMKWVIQRTLGDFANLHLKYKLHIGTKKYIQLRGDESGNTLPRFPRSAFPYLRGVRGLESDSEDEDDDAGNETAAEASGTERANKKKKSRSLGGTSRRQSSWTTEEAGSIHGAATETGEEHAGPTAAGAAKKETFSERQRKKLEVYLQKMIRFLIFRPDSNRLCKFLELSALGVRLASEGSYHGKEGFLVIQSSKGLDFRKAVRPGMMKSRHSPKWFLVRHSYIVCVDSPEGMHIYDVFLVDPFFKLQGHKIRLRDQKPKDIAQSAKDSAAHPQQHHTLKLQNSERKLRLLARNERQLMQFEDSIRFMVENTLWSKPNRFDSFAPVRQKCFAQWMVDARDYMWMVSRAIDQAKDVIYIHDWWLSPELYLRRPPAISQKWRLDRLLQRKAREGVKVFVIMYRNINTAIPIDSEYSKFSLLDLHPNVFVQRSPNQFRQNTFFWAHHEKLCLVDHTLAFIGGIDLCFGRWDTPQHQVTDDKLTGFETTDTPKDADNCQLWPGKDYSNPGVLDFYELDKPYEEMYDRTRVARVPWHDVGMHVVGQPARDLTRHFVQRWNYILRQRKPTRPTPFLLPPPDFNPADLEALGLDGNCEIQILRSSGMWSTGTPDITEISIMNAYVKLIETSDHFVYIENQFFVSSCEIDGKRVENLIGDALVERILRAARNGEAWRAVIIIPLMPAFQNTVDTESGTSLRRIMQCQYRSICRGESSIFGRLRAQGIDPDDYIQVYSLRAWGKIGPRKHLVTEQIYVHAKTMIVDDRVAIIGSANINERSMLGYRDSETAAMVRDTDMIWSTMNGAPYLVGRFPHTLRMRLMREHIGINVDQALEEDMAAEAAAAAASQENSEETTQPETAGGPSRQVVDPSPSIEPAGRQTETEYNEKRDRLQNEYLTRTEHIHSFNHDVDWEQANNPNLKSSRKLTADSRVTSNMDHRKDLEGEGVDQMKAMMEAGQSGGRDTYVSHKNAEYLVSRDEVRTSSGRSENSALPTDKDLPEEHKQENNERSSCEGVRTNGVSQKQTQNQGAPAQNEKDESQPLPHVYLDAPGENAHPLASELERPAIDKDCMKDPLHDSFYLDIWQTIAENNTRLFRTVFRCMPDSDVKSWKDFKEYNLYAERFADMQNTQAPVPDASQPAVPRPESRAQSGPPGSGYVPVTGKIGDGLGKAGQDIKEKLSGLGPGSGPNEQAEQEELRRWASEKNKSQLEREEVGEPTDLEPQISTSHLGEKDALKRLGTKSTQSSRNQDNSFPAIEIEKTPQRPDGHSAEGGTPNLNASLSQRRRRRGATRGSRREFQASDDIIGMRQAEELLKLVQGHLVLWPYEWLEKEEQGGNWLYTLDQISPFEIYN